MAHECVTAHWLKITAIKCSPLFACLELWFFFSTLLFLVSATVVWLGAYLLWEKQMQSKNWESLPSLGCFFTVFSMQVLPLSSQPPTLLLLPSFTRFSSFEALDFLLSSLRVWVIITSCGFVKCSSTSCMCCHCPDRLYLSSSLLLFWAVTCRFLDFCMLNTIPRPLLLGLFLGNKLQGIPFMYCILLVDLIPPCFCDTCEVTSVLGFQFIVLESCMMSRCLWTLVATSIAFYWLIWWVSD